MLNSNFCRHTSRSDRRFGHVAISSLLTVFALTAVLGALCGCSRSISDANIVRLDPGRIHDYSAPRLNPRDALIDVRPSEEFAAGHIPGAINLRLTDLDDAGRHQSLTGRRTLIVYGRNPGSAAANAMTKRLMSAGYRDVRLYDQGFDAWRAAGRPIATLD